jgi:hypothetical protein
VDTIDSEKPGDWTAAAEAHPDVVERYTGYTPPFDVTALTGKLLASVPSRYLHGLSRIVLTNAGDLSRKLRRQVTKSRGRKVKVRETRGLYHPASKNEPAWIEIFVDNTLRAWERGWWLKLRYLREELIGDILFHEIGHHIHFVVRPEYRETEDVADVWKVRLSRNYSRKAYPLLRAVARTVKFLTGNFLDRFARKSAERALEKGLISRAEFEEQYRKSKEP